MSEAGQLLRTPLYEEHLAAGARMVPFVGYSMPVQYSSLVEEHNAVRTRAGLFDVSHMGEIFVRGPASDSSVQRLERLAHALRVNRVSSREGSRRAVVVRARRTIALQPVAFHTHPLTVFGLGPP